MMPCSIQMQVAELLSAYQIPSAAIGVLHNDEITDFAVGVKNLGTGEPATTDTIYQCGSLTKTWTTLAFMQLVGEGKVRLDEPVRTYLPGFKVADPALTLDPSRYLGVYQRPGARYEVNADGEALCLTFIRDQWQARVAGQPERTTHELLHLDETHFLMPPHDPLGDPQTVAIYDFRDGIAQHLHHQLSSAPTDRQRLITSLAEWAL